MVPRTAIADWVLAGEQLRPTRLAHRYTEVGAIERQSLCSQPINVWRLCILPTVQGQVVLRTVIVHYDEDIGLFGRVQGERKT